MKRSKLAAAIIIISALVAAKALFPEYPDAIAERARTVFARDIDYRELLGGLGESIAVFARGEAEEQEPAAVILQPVAAERSAWSAGELAAEAAVSLGESRASEPAVPDAVAAFLESQEPYAEYALPETVSYEYSPFPEDYSVPVAGYSSSGFGYRLHPIKGEVRFHYGTDFAAWTGEAVCAFAGGTVTFAGYSDSYGNYVTIDHAGGWSSLYAHCSELCVETGDTVETGQRIALVGETGLATGPHLHFELTKDGVYLNPEYYVN